MSGRPWTGRPGWAGLTREFFTSTTIDPLSEIRFPETWAITSGLEGVTDADEHFVIDRDPGAPEVLLLSPCSGHGFKFASVVGEIVADLVERDATRHEIGLFRLGRLAGRVAL